MCAYTAVGKIRNWSGKERGMSAFSVGQCAASLPVSLWDGYKRISDVDAASEGAAGRTQRVLYHCGVRSQWVLLVPSDSMKPIQNMQVSFHTCSQGKAWESWEREKEGNRIASLNYVPPVPLVSNTLQMLDEAESARRRVPKLHQWLVYWPHGDVATEHAVDRHVDLTKRWSNVIVNYFLS